LGYEKPYKEDRLPPRSEYKIDWEDVAWDHGFKGDYKGMLHHWYHVEKLSQTKIGERLGVCAKTVSDQMKKVGVQCRPVGSTHNTVPRVPRGTVR
jgi:hypothetical protein